MLKLFKFLKPYIFYIIAILILVFFQALSELYLPNMMSSIVNIGIISGNTSYIKRVGSIMLLVAMVSISCAVTAGYLSSRVSIGFGKTIRNKIFSKVQNYSLSEFNNIGTSSLITRTTNDVMQVEHSVMIILRMMVRAPMMCIGGIVMAVLKDAKLSLVIAIAMPVLAGAIFIVTRKALPLFSAMQSKLDKLNLVLREGLTGVRVIRAFNRIESENRRFNDVNLDFTITAIKVNRLMAFLMPAMTMIMNFTAILVIWFGGIRINDGTMQVGDLMAFVQYVIQILFSLMMFSMMFIMIPRASVSAKRINEVLDSKTDIEDSSPFKNLTGNNNAIEFRNVTFRYPDSEQPVIKNVSFSAQPGEITAIIGGTGSGKSTLINLILRFYDVDSGSVLVNGTDVREIPQKDLRSIIGFSPQKSVVFTGTIADNIRYGKEDATDEEIKLAADIAQATEFIADMKDGFDSVIAQGGTNISGGQKQRLSIARALVRKPKIYIFDDSFSALDFKTDAKLRMALRENIKDATMIIVAQRVSTVMNADKIVVLDSGEIVGIGKHKELLNTCNVYKEIVSSQLSEEEIL